VGLHSLSGQRWRCWLRCQRDWYKCELLNCQGALAVFTHPSVNNVGVDTVAETNACNGGASLATFANDLEFELWTVKPPLGDYGASLARHRVHDLHRAHYRRSSARAQDVFTGCLRESCGGVAQEASLQLVAVR
jgi:hypothetical protein